MIPVHANNSVFLVGYIVCGDSSNNNQTPNACFIYVHLNCLLTNVWSDTDPKLYVWGGNWKSIMNELRSWYSKFSTSSNCSDSTCIKGQQ